MNGRAAAKWKTGNAAKRLGSTQKPRSRSQRTDRSTLLSRRPSQFTVTPRGTVVTALGIRRGRPGETSTNPLEHIHFAVGSQLIWPKATSTQCKLIVLAKGLGATQKPPNRHREVSPKGAAGYDSPAAL